MKVYLNNLEGYGNYITDHEGLRVVFDRTEWLDGTLYLHVKGECIACLDKEPNALSLFETSEYVIEHKLTGE